MQEDKNEQGFTLIELLVAIVVVGILTAVAIVGIGGLTNKGSSSACSTTADAASTAAAVHYANTNAYPADFLVMKTAKELSLQGGAVIQTADPTKIDGKGGWTLTLVPGATATDAPTFTSNVTNCP